MGAYSLRRLVLTHYRHGREHGDMLRGFHPDLQAGWQRDTLSLVWAFVSSKPTQVVQKP